MRRGQELLIHIALGIRLLQKLLQLHFRRRNLHLAALDGLQLLLEIALARARHIDLVLQRLRDLIDLAADLRADAVQLGLRGPIARVLRAEPGGGLRQPLRRLRFPLTQPLNQRRGENFSGRVTCQAAARRRLRRAQAGFGLGAVGAGQTQLRIQFVELLIAHGPGTGFEQAMLAAIFLHLLIGVFDLFLERRGTLLDPGIGLHGFLRRVLDLVGDESFHHRVHHGGPGLRRLALEVHVDDVTLAIGENVQLLADVGDYVRPHPLLSSGRCEFGIDLAVAAAEHPANGGQTILQTAEDRFEEGRLLQVGIEFGIAIELQLARDIGDELARTDNLRLAAHRGRIRGQRRHRVTELRQIGRPRIDREDTLGQILRRQLHRRDVTGQTEKHHDAEDHHLAAPERAENLAQADLATRPWPLDRLRRRQRNVIALELIPRARGETGAVELSASVYRTGRETHGPSGTQADSPLRDLHVLLGKRADAATHDAEH